MSNVNWHSFQKISIKGANYLQDDSGNNVLHVDNPHALIQAVGYLKFNAEPYERIFLRGQRALYGSLSPTLYRGITSTSGQSKKHEKLNNIIDVFRKNCDIFNKFPDYVHEPLLQHYGIHTTWIDVVDNVWIAIWFSAYKAYSEGKNGEFLHFDLRKLNENDKYCYIILLSSIDDRRNKTKKGMILGHDTEVIDLRIAAPSIFLRPHSQHGLLFRSKGKVGGRSIEYSSSIKGIIRFDLENAINWLGSGNMVGVRGLFPPPYYDHGYKILLSVKIEDFSVGTINHVGA